MKTTNRRQFLSTAVAVGVTSSLASRSLTAESANEEIRLGFIGCGGRAGKLLSQFEGLPGVAIAALCDVDADRLSSAKERFPAAKSCQDMRELIEDYDVDAVVIATCNHWHCLAAIWAMEAGKHVYVEKPLSHTQWEGRQVVAAVRKYDRICQVGTQQRSDPMQAEIKKFLHEEKALGEIQSARVNHYFIRKPIGKRDTPLPVAKNVAYDLWCGPAQKSQLFRDSLHYDWHWDWNTGSGDMGNWGVHVLDDVRNNVFQDSVALPKRILAGGGRVVFNDAGQTPNVHFAYFDTGSIPVVIGLTNLPGRPGSKKSPDHLGPGSGYIAYCEGGSLEGQRSRAVAKDTDGKVIKEFKGNSGDVLHQQNFIDAVRSHDRSILNAEASVGNDSTGWCNLANVAFRAGGSFNNDTAESVSLDDWKNVLSAMGEHLKTYDQGLATDSIRLSPMLELDPKTERFVGSHADAGNPFLKREYRQGFEVPELA
ncbi:Gfo/Idh/MocA family protein [Rubripirellula reticaptiva]|uniref:4-carboxy-2-hydroxymuconate-6-semialdehyde dehydrogenase n=1 Tax=Rubripirellula reticaptiva TaxID=2528013 RepID=A0A5C6EVP9_9BACT|nr:Gfo/Idh/MocA family oxidoreductase [Rubripirellula reticaptiva]TWU51726.1 4-carboxy-2-hydroxymuconate-6-semialdehyde dehydrogenase [Rubripirellula reticaptiva]